MCILSETHTYAKKIKTKLFESSLAEFLQKSKLHD